MPRFKYETPGEFKDEEKWFKIFSKKQLAVFSPLVVCTGLLIKILNLFGIKWLVWLGGTIGGLLTIIVTATTFFPIPEEEYMKGGGSTWDVFLLKKILRRMNRCIYVKGYGDEDEWNR